MILAGPCLLNDDPKERKNFYDTAEAVAAFDDPDLFFRCKVIGGGTTPEKWAEGIRDFQMFLPIHNPATEVHTIGQARAAASCGVGWLWVGARNAQNYTLLMELAPLCREWDCGLIVKRHPGMGIAESWGIHDLYKAHGAPDVYLCERGINTFNRTDAIRWQPDFQFMAQTLENRPDIQLMFDVSHASFDKRLLFRYTRAARAMGVQHFMVECYVDPTATRSDKAHALDMDEFRQVYEIMKS